MPPKVRTHVLCLDSGYLRRSSKKSRGTLTVGSVSWLKWCRWDNPSCICGWQQLTDLLDGVQSFRTVGSRRWWHTKRWSPSRDKRGETSMWARRQDIFGLPMQLLKLKLVRGYLLSTNNHQLQVGSNNYTTVSSVKTRTDRKESVCLYQSRYVLFYFFASEWTFSFLPCVFGFM